MANNSPVWQPEDSTNYDRQTRPAGRLKGVLPGGNNDGADRNHVGNVTAAKSNRLLSWPRLGMASLRSD